MNGRLKRRMKGPKTPQTPQHLPFCPSVSLSASESDAIGFFLFIRRTSSSLSLPLADSNKEHNYSQQIKNFGPQILKFLSINKLWKCCIKKTAKMTIAKNYEINVLTLKIQSFQANVNRTVKRDQTSSKSLFLY